MVETKPPAFPVLTADDYAAAVRSRNLRFALGATLLALAMAVAYTVLELDKPIFPLLLFTIVVTPILLWRLPRMALYVTFGAVCLFEIFKTIYSDSLTDGVPFFWNFNTIVQMYTGQEFTAVPFNLFEVFAITAAFCSTFRTVFTKTTDIRVGAMLYPILLYLAFVLMGWAHGIMSGGDFKISLQEVRAQFYFLFAYLMAFNMVRDRSHLRAIMWIMVICIGIKGILYTFRRFVTLSGLPVPDQGVGSHEEAFFFDCFIVWFLVLLLCGLHKRMQYFMWALLPLVLLGDFACNRRAATAAFIIVIPVLLLAAYRAFPERRKFAAIVGVVLLVGFSSYYRAFRNSDSLYAQPARAVKSQFEPDERDASSNAYRDAEAADLYATIKSSPIIGYGYGRPMFHAVPIADISADYPLWDIMTHNQILWVWMRVGSIGFFVFWMMICGIIVQACMTMRSLAYDQETKAVALFTLLAVCMLLMFGLLDLQLSNFRDMLFVGFFTGLMVGMPLLKQLPISDFGGRRSTESAIIDSENGEAA